MTNRDCILGVKSRGQLAYEYRLSNRCSWNRVAEELGYDSRTGVYLAAKKYALERNLPFPLSRMTKGGCIYVSRAAGLSWHMIANQFGDTIKYVQKEAHAWSKRNGRDWPPLK